MNYKTILGLLIAGILVLLIFLFNFQEGLTFNARHPQQETVSLSHLATEMSVDHQNWESGKHSFPDGIYYEYAPASGEENEEQNRISHPEFILGYLSAQGVDIQDAWYKSYSSSCSPPDSDMAMDVIVPAKLIIRVSSSLSESMDIESLGLQKRDNPSMGNCAYDIRHYSFVSGDAQ